MSFFPNASIGITGSAFPIYSTLVGGSDGTDLRALLTDATGQLKVLVENSPAVTITGSVIVTQSTAANLNATVVGTGTFAAQVTGTVAVSGVTGVVEVGPTTAANTKTNPFFNEITDGTNVMGAMTNFGTTPGAITALVANASLFIGTAAATANSTTYSSKVAQDGNLLGTLGTAFTTPGLIDIKGADGNVFVRQVTPANLQATVTQVSGNWNDNIAQVGGNTVATAATGVQKVGIVGSAGGVIDAAQNATAPANELVIGAIYNTTVPALTAGNATQNQADVTGATLVSTEGRKSTYSVAYNFIPQASSIAPTFSLQGSGTKTIKITRIRFSLNVATGATTPAGISFGRFSALSGGTVGTTPTPSKWDTNNANATAVAVNYSVLNTTNTQVGGFLDTFDYQLTTVSATTAPAPPPYDITYNGQAGSQPIVLRGTSDFFGLVIDAVGTGPHLRLMVQWTEE